MSFSESTIIQRECSFVISLRYAFVVERGSLPMGVLSEIPFEQHSRSVLLRRVKKSSEDRVVMLCVSTYANFMPSGGFCDKFLRYVEIPTSGSPHSLK